MTDRLEQCPPDHRSLCRRLAQLGRGSGALCVEELGRTVRGNSIPAVHLGSRTDRVLLVGGVHGMEWLTTLLLCRFLQLLAGLTEGRCCLPGFDAALFSQRGVTVVPCLNPDGVEIAGGYNTTCINGAIFSKSELKRWQANANGVDLNHNFDAGWAQARAIERAAGIDGPGPTRYGGPAAESEPESRALADFCRREQNTLRAAYALHTQGEEIYYRYGDATPPRAEAMARLLAASSGYRLAEPVALASHAGFKDWFIAAFGKPGFTLELGRGQNPLPPEQLEPIWEQLRETLLLTLLL